jgi:signal transduction histidine kinase
LAGGEPVTDKGRTQKRAPRPAWRRSLAWRLATLYLLTTLSILLALGAALYLLTRYYVYQRLDAELAAQADFYAAYAAQLAGDEAGLAVLAPSLVRLFSTQADVNVRVFAASSGALLAATQEIGPQPSQAALQTLAYRSPTLFTQPSRDLPGRRYAAKPVLANAPSDDPVGSDGFSRPVGSPTDGRRGSGRAILGVVEVSRSTLANERTLATLSRILAFAALLAVLLTLFASAFLARRLSRPIRDVEQAAQRIASGDLAVRLEERGPDELRALAASINRMARQLEEYEASRVRFISEIAHDLRTPLAAVKGLVVNQIDASAEPQPALALAEQETDRLIRLVNQLLDYARWQAGQLALNRRPTDLCTLAGKVVALCQPRAGHREIELTADLEPGMPDLRVDPDRVERAMLNLLDNALRFTPAGGQVTLAVVADTPHREAVVSVQDTGRGMTKAEQESVYQALGGGLERRSPEGSQVAGGTGLGLTITQAIVHAHGGRLGIQSPVDGFRDRGTRVWFTLPL